MERVSFAMALQRLCAPGSDLAGSQWVSGIECPGFDKLELQHFYRTTSFLAEVRDELEAELSWRDRDLFSLDLDLIFIDTTSLYVYTDSETDLRRRGYSRDRRPDLPQFVLCVVVNRHGWPVAWDIFPGDTAGMCGHADDGEQTAQASADQQCRARGRSRDDLDRHHRAVDRR